MAQFKADVDMLTTADSGARPLSGLIWCMIHTTENTDTTRPESVANWQLNPANGSSYNLLFGVDGRTVRSNDDDYCPWSAGMPGNRLAIHGSAIGYASRTREQWLAHDEQLNSIAAWLAHNEREYGIPLVELTVDEVAAARKKGITTHAVYWQAIAKKQGMDFRSDPGAGFPMDIVLKKAKAINAPKKEVEPVEDNSEVIRLLHLILDQLAGHPGEQFAGWEQLNGNTLVNAVAEIGSKIGLEGYGK